MSDLLTIARDVALAAGDLLLSRFGGRQSGVSSKSTSTDLVSDADRDAETLIRSRLSAARPHDAIVGEESADTDGTSGVTWFVDPLDGTVNYLFGIPHWSVSIAAADATGAVVGVVHDPCRGETFAAGRGKGATLDGRPVTTRPCSGLSHALVATGFAYDARVRAMQAAAVAALLPRVRDVRRLGSAALDLAWVACGRYDAYWESPLSVWDRAAGELLVVEAGGRTAELTSPRPGGVLASTPAIFDALLSEIR